MTGNAKHRLWHGMALLFFFTGLPAVQAASTPTPTSTPVLVMLNPELTGSGVYPQNWQGWGGAYQTYDTNIFLGPGGNAWKFWWDAGIFQDFSSGFSAGDRIYFGSHLFMPSIDPMRGAGHKHGRVDLEFWASGNTFASSAVTALPVVDASSPSDTWFLTTGTALVPSGADFLRLVIRMGDPSPGDGMFCTDNAFIQNLSLDPFTPTRTPEPTRTALPTPTRTPAPSGTAPVAFTATGTPGHPLGSNGVAGAAHPNPFLPGRGQVTRFGGNAGAETFRSIRVVNSHGEKVRELRDANAWDGRDDAGNLCEGGIYFYQLETGGRPVSGTVVLIR